MIKHRKTPVKKESLLLFAFFSICCRRFPGIFFEHILKITLSRIAQNLSNLSRCLLCNFQKPFGFIHFYRSNKVIDCHACFFQKSFAQIGAVHAPGCDDRGDTSEAMLSEAVKAAGNAEAAVVFAGLPDRYESEGFDRENMKMPEGHLRMIEAVAEANPNIIVVLLCGCVVECPWADRVKAVLYMGLPGQAGGEAIANLLYGRVSPCGRLPVL